jgi:hypothetical protein
MYRPGGIDTPAVVLSGETAGGPDMLGITPEAVVGAWRWLVGSQRGLRSEQRTPVMARARRVPIDASGREHWYAWRARLLQRADVGREQHA